MAQVNVASSTLQEWSRHYNAIAQEQQRSHNVIPDRMPSESCNEMLELQDKIGLALERMREMIYQQQHAAITDQRMREQGGKGPSDYDAEMNVYPEDIKIHSFPGSDGKKRRGVRLLNFPPFSGSSLRGNNYANLVPASCSTR